MFTLFHAFELLGLLFGLIVGALIGYRLDGVPAALLGALFGAAAGTFLGRLPFALGLFLMQRSMERGGVEALEQRLEKEYYLSHHLLAQLAAQGAPMERYEGYVLSLLRSEQEDKRQFGWTNLKVWFPALAEKVGPFDPAAPVEECRKRLEVLTAGARAPED